MTREQTLSRIFSVMRGIVSPRWIAEEMKRAEQEKARQEKTKRKPKKHGGPVKKYAKGGKVKK